ncbi:MAG: hypothetical protein H7338_13530 [Candidatus Sericytochromatia bacterium]|nr:hypothetical protein [Candidatus Sericytochromatia bacterium]
MPPSNPHTLSANHPILRASGRSALSIAQTEHQDDIAAWQCHVGALVRRGTAADMPHDLTEGLHRLAADAASLDPADLLGLDLEAVRHGYRQLLKRTVAWEPQASWQAPAMRASGHPQAGAHQQPVLPFYNDYQRYAIPMDAAEAELQALHESGHSLRPTSHLFSSGMGAFATLFQALRAESTAPPVIGQHLYFECGRLLNAVAADAIFADETDPAGMLDLIRKHQPEQVFIDPVANSPQLPTVDFAAVMATLAGLPGERLRTLIVDTTLLGPAFQPEAWLKGASWPDHIRLIAYRSLQKLDQLGLDLVTGGMVTVWAHHPLPLASFRQLCGTHPTEEALHLLPFPDREALLAKLNRHERNVSTLGNWLQSLKSPWLGTVHLADAQLLAGHVGPLFWVDWSDRLDAADAQRFCHHLVETATAMDVPMAYGTSFGFATMRVAAFSRSNGPGTALRIAPGTENLARLARIADVWTAALASFGARLAEAWLQDPACRMQRLCAQADRVIQAEALTGEGCRELTLLLQRLLDMARACSLSPELIAVPESLRARISQPLAARLASLVPEPDPDRRPDLATLQALTDALAALDEGIRPKRRWPWGGAAPASKGPVLRQSQRRPANLFP